MTDAEQRLAECRAGIKAILEKGQRIRKGDREVQRAELSSLRILEAELARQVASETATRVGRGRSRIILPRL